MTNIDISQAEADRLLGIEKRRNDESSFSFPLPGDRINIPLISVDGREAFSLDIQRGRIDLQKRSYQTRGRNVIVLARLDVSGPPHRNPDGEEIPTPHLHIYREGYGAKWATIVTAERFSDLSDPMITLEKFMDFCNITLRPLIDGTLF